MTDNQLSERNNSQFSPNFFHRTRLSTETPMSDNRPERVGVRDNSLPNESSNISLIDSPGNRQLSGANSLSAREQEPSVIENGITNAHHRTFSPASHVSSSAALVRTRMRYNADSGENVHREPIGRDSATNNVRSRPTSLSSPQSGKAESQSCDPMDVTKDEGAINKGHSCLQYNK